MNAKTIERRCILMCTTCACIFERYAWLWCILNSVQQGRIVLSRQYFTLLPFLA